MDQHVREEIDRSELEGELLANRVRFAFGTLGALTLLASYEAQTPAANLGFGTVAALILTHALVWPRLLKSPRHHVWHRYVSVVVEVWVIFGLSIGSLLNYSGVYELYRSPALWLWVALANALSAVRLRAGLCLCAAAASLVFGGVQLALLLASRRVTLVSFSNYLGEGMNLPDLLQPILMLPTIALFAAVVVRRNRALVVRAAEEAVRAASLSSEHARSLAETAALREASDEKRRFLRIVAHELRSPLQTLSTAAELLGRDYSPRHLDEFAGRIGRQVRRLTRIVEPLVERGASETPLLSIVPAECNLVALCRQVVLDMSPDDARFEVRATEDVVGCWDGARLEQVIANLCSNAVRYSSPDTPIVVTVRRDGGFAVIELRDRGIGVAEEDLEHIFSLFYRASHARVREAAGLGIGLYVSRTIVEAHGGTIEAKRADPGTTFVVRLPCSKMVDDRESADACYRPDGCRSSMHA